MNRQNNIDRLFSEKVAGYTTSPSPESWKKLEKRIGTKKKPRALWLSVAASIALLVAAWVIWQFPGSDTPAFTYMETGRTDATHPPSYTEPGTFSMAAVQEALTRQELIQTTQKETQPVAQSARPKQQARVKLAGKMAYAEADIAKTDFLKKNNNDVQPLVKSPHLPLTSAAIVQAEPVTMETGEIQSVAEAGHPYTADPMETSPVSDPQNTLLTGESTGDLNKAEPIAALPAVSITYQGGETKEESSKSKKFSFKKVLSSAKKLANGELIAEIREAKDELFDSGVKSLND